MVAVVAVVVIHVVALAVAEVPMAAAVVEKEEEVQLMMVLMLQKVQLFLELVVMDTEMVEMVLTQGIQRPTGMVVEAVDIKEALVQLLQMDMAEAAVLAILAV